MRLALKMTLALVFGILLVLVADGYLRMRETAALFESDMRADHVGYGRAITSSVAETWETDGRDKAVSLVKRMDKSTDTVKLEWASIKPKRTGSGVSSSARTRRRAAVRKIESRLERDPKTGRQHMHTYVPVFVKGKQVGTLELSEPIEHQKEFLQAALRRIALTMTISIGLCGILAMALGFLLAGRPIRQLVLKARQVGAGDFSGKLVLRQHDEIGELGREMNLMSEQLDQAQQRLQAETAERLAALGQLRHADRLATVGKLASGIAHELGTPLNVVTGRARMIASGEVTGAEVVENAQVIAQQSERMAKIIRQLLDFARRRDPKRADTDLHQLAEHTLALFKPMAEKARVTVALEGPHLSTSVDAGQIQQAVSNLVLNAIQAMPDGGHLTVSLDRRRLTPPPDVARRDDRWLVVTVADQGTGIPEDQRVRIFDPFFTTKAIGQGTGLGLSVTYGIVQEHGGWIDVESQINKGSRFLLHLPDEEKIP